MVKIVANNRVILRSIVTQIDSIKQVLILAYLTYSILFTSWSIEHELHLY